MLPAGASSTVVLVNAQSSPPSTVAATRASTVTVKVFPSRKASLRVSPNARGLLPLPRSSATAADAAGAVDDGSAAGEVPSGESAAGEVAGGSGGGGLSGGAAAGGGAGGAGRGRPVGRVRRGRGSGRVRRWRRRQNSSCEAVSAGGSVAVCVLSS